MQSEARYVRTGHHGRRVEGVEPGRFEDSAELPVAMFPHHCNREGEPHLHIHLLILNKVQTLSDGLWRATRRTLNLPGARRRLSYRRARAGDRAQ